MFSSVFISIDSFRTGSSDFVLSLLLDNKLMVSPKDRGRGPRGAWPQGVCVPHSSHVSEVPALPLQPLASSFVSLAARDW